jgi:hypothetical protein
VGIRKLTTGEPDQEQINQIVDNPAISVTGHLQAEFALKILESYDQLGVILRTGADHPSRLFVPWSAMIEMWSAEPSAVQE